MFSIFHAPRKYQKYYAPYYEIFNFYEGREAWLRSIENIPIKAVNLFSVHWLHYEIYNGGFWQYFFNSTCVSFPEAKIGFQAIGMPEVASLIEKAALLVGDPFPFDMDKRRLVVGYPIDRMDFGELTDKFYELADTDKIFRRQPKFVQFAEAYAESDSV